LIRVWSIVNVQCVLLVWFISYIYIYIQEQQSFPPFLAAPCFLGLQFVAWGISFGSSFHATFTSLLSKASSLVPPQSLSQLLTLWL
jgi:hypothetical protein